MKKSFLACISLATLSALTLTGCQDGEWKFDHEDPIVVHVPQDSVIVTINPNMVPDGAKKG